MAVVPLPPAAPVPVVHRPPLVARVPTAPAVPAAAAPADRAAVVRARPAAIRPMGAATAAVELGVPHVQSGPAAHAPTLATQVGIVVMPKANVPVRRVAPGRRVPVVRRAAAPAATRVQKRVSAPIASSAAMALVPPATAVHTAADRPTIVRPVRSEMGPGRRVRAPTVIGRPVDVSTIRVVAIGPAVTVSIASAGLAVPTAVAPLLVAGPTVAAPAIVTAEIGVRPSR